MKRELTVQGKTIEAAIELACDQLGTKPDEIQYEVLEEPKKGFLGMGAVQAKVKVWILLPPAEVAATFVRTVLKDMDINANVQYCKNADGDLIIKVAGEEAGMLIGYHGETLDTLQHLVNLATNRKDYPNEKREYTRVVLDIEGYRERREETLRILARKLAASVRKTQKNIKLEPMSATDRRVIHSEIQKYKGITTFSVGQEPKRRVVVAIDKNDSANDEATENE